MHRDSLGSRADDPAGRRELDDGRPGASCTPSARPPRRAGAAGRCTGSSAGWRCRPRDEETRAALRAPPGGDHAARSRAHGATLRHDRRHRLRRALAGRRAARRRSTSTARSRPARRCRSPDEHAERAHLRRRGRGRASRGRRLHAAGRWPVFQPRRRRAARATAPARVVLSAARRSTASGTSGGTSSPARPSASSARRPTGRKGASRSPRRRARVHPAAARPGVGGGGAPIPVPLSRLRERVRERADLASRGVRGPFPLTRASAAAPPPSDVARRAAPWPRSRGARPA